MADQNRTATAEHSPSLAPNYTGERASWLGHTELSFKRIVNLARKATDLRDLPTGIWLARLNNMIDAAVRGELIVASRESREERHWTALVLKVWDFVSSAKGNWGWLRDFCEEWAATCGVTPPVVAPTPSNNLGRPSGSGSYKGSDAVLIEEMHQMIKNGSALSATQAATSVVGRAKGGGQKDSKVKRLARGYRLKHLKG